MEKSINVNLDPTLAERGVSVIFMLARGSLTSDADAVLAKLWQDVQIDFKTTHTLATALNHPHLLAYRKLHAGLGISDSSITPSPESLVRLLLDTERLRSSKLRSLGPVVDLYNTVALQYLISIGAHDAEKLGHHVNLAMNNAGIKFRPLGQKKKLLLPENEYSYRTDDTRAICRLECKQANETKLRPETDCWLFILQGNENIAKETLAAACESLTDSLTTHLGNQCITTVMLTNGDLSATLSLSA